MVNLFATGMVGSWFGRLLTGGIGLQVSLQAPSCHIERDDVLRECRCGWLTHLWWLPLGLGLLLKAMADPTWKRWAGECVLLVGAVLSCFYLGFFLGVAVGVVCAWHLAVNSDRLLYAQRMAFAADS